MSRARHLLVATALAAGCGGDAKKDPAAPGSDVSVPERAATAGEALLAHAPAGADAILEIDFARLRANPVVGDLFSALSNSSPALAGGGLDLMSAADLLVVVSYEIGDAEPERLVLLKGAKTDSIAGATAVSEGVVALASEAMSARLQAVARGDEPSLSTDKPLLKIRALAMPERADAAVLRMAARLDFDGRIAVARALELEDVPVSVSVWGDVVDDLALVALANGVAAGEGTKLARGLERVRDKAAAIPQLRWLGLGPVIRGAEVEAAGVAARLVLLIGPKRLALIARKLERSMRRASETEP